MTGELSMHSGATVSAPASNDLIVSARRGACKVAVIWIDWYAYHVARFRGILSDPTLAETAQGIELVGGVGVHQGLKFRENLPADLPIETLMSDSSWHEVGKLQLALKLWRVLSRINPEVVLVPGYYTLPGLAAASWAKLHGAKSVLMSESGEEDHQRTWWKERLKAGLIRGLFDWVVTGGKAHVRYLARLGFPINRIGHFYDVVENRSYQERTALLRQQSHEAFDLPKRYFLYIGRLAEEKNVAGLIRAWVEYRNCGGTWSLVLVGDGPAAGTLRALATESGQKEEIYFAGHKRSEELPKYYAFAGCFVLASKREPWGLVVNEAMASGLPVIVSNRCGCAEDLVIPGVNGIIFDPDEETSLTTGLTRIGALEEIERLQMGMHSSRIIERYSPRSFGREIARIASS